MRRKDREVTDLATIQQIFKDCTICHLGMTDDQGMYIVPMNFGYAYENGNHVLYFHGAAEGRRMDALTKNNQVCFQMETNTALVGKDTACTYTCNFQSIFGQGTVEMLTDLDDKKAGFRVLMEHLTTMKQEALDALTYKAEYLEICAVFKLTVSELSVKWHK